MRKLLFVLLPLLFLCGCEFKPNLGQFHCFNETNYEVVIENYNIEHTIQPNSESYIEGSAFHEWNVITHKDDVKLFHSAGLLKIQIK